jgi:hypothetical protein
MTRSIFPDSNAFWIAVDSPLVRTRLKPIALVKDSRKELNIVRSIPVCFTADSSSMETFFRQ